MLILHAMAEGPVYWYGIKVMERTGLASGTVYPAMRNMERDGLVQSHWEQQSIADAEQRPLRKYYKLTCAGLQLLPQRMGNSKSLISSQDTRENR
jgi:DNA-binding PadR family transcriptional regulator